MLKDPSITYSIQFTRIYYIRVQITSKSLLYKSIYWTYLFIFFKNPDNIEKRFYF